MPLLAAAAVLAMTLFTEPVDVIVLHSGARIPVRGDVFVERDQAVFRHANGLLYSLPVDEIDVEATRNHVPPPPLPPRRAEPAKVLSPSDGRIDGSIGLKVSEDEKQRLLDELKSSRGTAVSPRPETSGAKAAAPEPARTTVDVDSKNDEWYWRRESRRYEEAVRQKEEDLDLLVSRERDLNDQILGFLSLGYKPHEFSYSVLQLENTRNQIPYAQLELDRAKRALEQFKDDARRQGILPGWLR